MPEPRVRLLSCGDCRTVEDLPDYQGDPAGDIFLHDALSKHVNPDGSPHAHGKLMDVETKHWLLPSHRESILKRIQEVSGHTGLDPDFYAAKATYGEDALKCFARHNRNPKCSDYKGRSKVLTPATQALRKELGIPKYNSNNPSQNRYLCEFCPVHSVVMADARWKAGQYK